ncbi:MAG: alkyldihydroxyacetonephosphate synthase, partial [Thermoleophilaceae bacterium]|nr:alkyldihydroxyacetonephosphate synthase [Thermoleophilaceae bacterium]
MALGSDLRQLKFWGWGYEDQQPPPDEVSATAAAAREHLGFEPAEVERPARLEDLELPAPRIEPPASLARLCSSDPYERASHAYGKAYRDIVRAFRGRIDNPPDVVARPREEADVERLLDWCATAGAAAIPFGGGTSVVGGVEPRGLDAAVAIDMRALDRVLEVDTTSRAALIEAGATGPRLEEQLREHGLTLRHYPQSFEYSTLGGWIATRAGGHFATLMTHIDDLVESVRAITPSGVWESRRLPGSGAGPSPDRMLIGSEGILGVITQAWMRLQDQPRFRAGASVHFDGFEAGAEAVRALAQSGLWPSNCRLLDPAEAALTGAAPEGKALLVLGFESADHPLDAWIERALECCADHGGEAERKGAGAGTWRNAFLQAPYLRDTLIAGGVLSETFETAITWERLPGFVAHVRERAEAAVAEVCG